MACVEIPELDPVTTHTEFSGGQVLLLLYVNHRVFHLVKLKWICHFYFFSFSFSRVLVPSKEEGVRHHSNFFLLLSTLSSMLKRKKKKRSKYYYSQIILGKLRTPSGPQTFVAEAESCAFFLFFFSISQFRPGSGRASSSDSQEYTHPRLMTNFSPWPKKRYFSLVYYVLSSWGTDRASIMVCLS